MELSSNLVWAGIVLALLYRTYRAVRRGSLAVPMASAMMVAVLLCFILLPAVSLSDDLLATREAALPAASQTWSIASADCSVGLDTLPTADLSLLVPECAPLLERRGHPEAVLSGAVAMRLIRSQRLRPPLA